MKDKLKRLAALVLTAVMVLGMTPAITTQAEAATGSIQAQFYVSATGNDEYDGTTPATAFATIARARDAVRAAKQSGMTQDIIVQIADGDYYLDETLTFTPEDSGTDGCEIIYRSESVGGVNLIGGQKIEGWIPTTSEDVNYDLAPELVGTVYKHTLTDEEFSKLFYDESRELCNRQFNTLYVNDTRATMARTQNRDNNSNFPMAKGEYMRSAGGSNIERNIIYRTGDLSEQEITAMKHAQERSEEVAQVFVWDGGDWDWFTDTIPVISIDENTNKLQFPQGTADYPEKYTVKYKIGRAGQAARYFLQGNLGFLDVPGEYHYNKTTHTIYYYPLAGEENMNDQTVIVPTMQKAVEFRGADKAQPGDAPIDAGQVHNITLDGLAVKDTEFVDYFTYSWNRADGGGYDCEPIGHYPAEALVEGVTNPSYCETCDRPEFRVGSITMNGTNHITLKNVRVKNSGMYGIIMDGDNTYNTITNSVVENTGYGGIIFNGGYPGVGKYNNHNTVENTLIHNVGELVGHAVGLTLMSSGQNTFTNLEIFNTPKRAILLIGGFRRVPEADEAYDELKDMYTVGNHFKYVYVHDAQQDAGEDSAVFLSWLIAGREVKRLHGVTNPNDYEHMTNLDGIDTSVDRSNHFDQMLITDVGADPSVIEKCTAGGLDTAMGVSGSHFTNVRAANTQAHLMAIRDQSRGDGYDDDYIYENCTNNLYTDDQLKTFDDSKMEYDKIGLTDEFPAAYRISKRTYREEPDDLYFGDDFESSRNLDTTKWLVEKGDVQGEMHVGYGYMSEDPTVGRRSLIINADASANKGGVVVSHPFEQNLNKIVEVQYMDRRKDYATNDGGDAVPTEILPNSFLRVDDGVNALGLGAVGAMSKDYYYIWKGDEYIRTDVKRCFGWHTFKFDYSSGTDVKLYIDDTLVATYTENDGVAMSFNYVAMGDWEGKGGKAFFDQLYIYGGQYAPTPGPLPEVHTFPGAVKLDGVKTSSGVTVVGEDENACLTDIAAGDAVEYLIKCGKDGAYDVAWGVSGPASFELYINGEKAEDAELTGAGEEKTRLVLNNGMCTLKLVAKTGGWNLNGISASYAGVPIPGKIEAEDCTACHSDIHWDDGAYASWLGTGRWMDYKIVVGETAVYQLEYNVGANNDNCQIDFVVNDKTLSSTKFNRTGGWESWQTVDGGKVTLQKGEYTVRVLPQTGGFNFNWMKFTKTDDEVIENPLPDALEKDLLIEDFENFEGNVTEVFKPTKTAVRSEEIVEENGSKVLKVVCDDGGILYDGGYDWSNYVFECRLKVTNYTGGTEDWRNFAAVWYGAEPASNGNYDHCMLQYQFNPKQLQMKMRANGGDSVVDDTTVSASGFMDTWHDYKIITDNGHITAYVDGVKVIDVTEQSLSKGTIGFESHNATFYVDDIKVTRIQSAAPTATITGEKDKNGKYTGNVIVELHAAEGATIVYSMDGKDPTKYGRIYDAEKPIQITGNTTLKFAAVETGRAYSDIVTETIRFALPAVEGEAYLNEDFESGASSFRSVKGKAVITYVPDPEDENNKVMKVASPDDLVYFPDGMDWSDYTFECRLYIEGWGGSTEGDKPWDNMAPVWYATKEDEKGNYARYSLKYKRDGETFSLYKRNVDDIDMMSVAAPANYAGSWHDYRLCAKDGVITAYIDGEEIFNYRDSALKRGTIGFDGINVTYYVDNVKVTGPHILTAHTATDATCTSDGSSAYWGCSICGKYFSDAAAAHEITENSWVIPTLNHNWDDGAVTKEPTETQEGEKTYTCKRCGDTKTETLPKLEGTPADTAPLEALVAEAGDLKEDDYTAETWAVFQAALRAAEAVLDNKGASQADVDAAKAALAAAIDGLTRKDQEEAPCRHEQTEYRNAVMPTRTTPGYSGDKYCLICGELLEKGRVIPATGTSATTPVTPATPVAPALPFTDVSKRDWFYPDVQYVYENNLMNGTDATAFSPNATLTRGMIVTILYRMEGEPGVRFTGTLDDVASGKWYSDAVEWAAKNEIVTGYPNGKFGPEDPVTREQLAAILYRYAAYKGVQNDKTAGLDRFADGKTVSGWAVEAMEWAVGNGLLQGSDNRLNPTGTATRAQVAKVLKNYCENIG